MDSNSQLPLGIREVLEAVRSGTVDVDDALAKLRRWPYEDLGYARLDHHRALRAGMPEVVFCPGKTPEQVADLMFRLAREHGLALATRAEPEHARAVMAVVHDAQYHEVARTIAVDRRREAPERGAGVVVVTGGTSDGPVAEEAAVTAEMVGARVTRVFDAGVAGIHRLLDRYDDLAGAAAIVAVAGMEGALPGVVAGLVQTPVVAVPTSVGYGAHLGGLAPLFTMLNSCAPGIAVVNIDNGFAAGYMAAMIDRTGAARPTAATPVSAATEQAPAPNSK